MEIEAYSNIPDQDPIKINIFCYLFRKYILDEDEKMGFSSNQNSINSTNLPLLTSSQISPLSAARAIMLSYTTDNNPLSPPARTIKRKFSFTYST